MNYLWHDLAGNIGVVFILATYMLLQLGRIKPESLVFSITNGVGAALVIVSLMVEFNMSAFIIEVSWLGISLVGIGLYFKRQKNSNSQGVSNESG